MLIFSVLNIYDCGIVLTYLSDADRNNAQTFAFIAVVTLADNQLNQINLISITWLLISHIQKQSSDAVIYI